jgi:hypothetical protein
MPTGLAVLYTTTNGTAPAPLVAGTTYFVIDPVVAGGGPDPNNFQLALTSTGAAVGLAIDLTAQTGNGSFKLTPLAPTGSLGIVWAASDDAVNFSNLVVSSVTLVNNGAKANTYWDFGLINAHYLQATVNAPGTQGGAYNVTIIGHGKAVR